MNVDGLLIGQAALAALMNVAFAFALGSATLAHWLGLDGAQAPAAASHAAWSRARASVVAAAFALVLADGGWLLYQAASMSGSDLFGALAVLPDVIGQTHVGHAWAVAFGGAALMLLTALLHRGGRLGQFMLWIAAAVVGAGAASLGHAADAGVLSLVSAMQFVHVLGTALWGGIVLAGGFVVLPALDASLTRTALIRVADRVSGTSLAAFALVAVSGVFAAYTGLGGDAGALRTTTWGHVLTLKLALVLLAVVLGGLNRLSALPRLRRTASTVDAHTFVNIVHLEAYVMVAVFVAAAALAQFAPAG